MVFFVFVSAINFFDTPAFLEPSYFVFLLFVELVNMLTANNRWKEWIRCVFW